MTDEPKNKRRNPRPKPMDFRVKLTAADYEVVTAHIAENGFTGAHAKQNWLRSQIKGMSPPAAARATRNEATPQRLPMPGGQEALALLGNVGTDLREMKRDLRRMREWIDRIDPVFIAEEHRERVREELPFLMIELLRRLDSAEASVTPRLNKAIDAVRKALGR
jgi:hypothetical protein